MTRVLVVVEGQTEGAFVKSVLAPYLARVGVWVEGRVVRTRSESGDRPRRGGGSWKTWRADLRRVCGSAGGAWVTTMLDLYGLPRGFPGRDLIASAPTPQEKIARAEEAILRDLTDVVGAERFLPYVQCHEFEALVLASLDSLRALLDTEADLRGLDDLQREIQGIPPEEINDGPQTAPSKRLSRHIPGYDKVLHGELAVTDASIPDLSARCPHFGRWVQRLAALGGVAT